LINPQWLCSDVIGQLLSYDCLMSGPAGGQFAIDQLRQMIPKADPSDAVLMLDSLELCVMIQSNGSTLYNVLNFDKSSAPSEFKFAHTVRKMFCVCSDALFSDDIRLKE
jgi:hypothetical protein